MESLVELNVRRPKSEVKVYATGPRSFLFMNFLTHLNAIQQIIYVSSVMWMRFVIMAAVFVMKDSEETALSAMVSKHTL